MGHLVNPAKIKFGRVIDIDENLQEAEFPNVKDHRICWSLFTLKKGYAKKLSCDDDNTIPSSTSTLHSSIWKSAVTPQRKCEKLPASYLFCQKLNVSKGEKLKKSYICAMNWEKTK